VEENKNAQVGEKEDDKVERKSPERMKKERRNVPEKKRLAAGEGTGSAKTSN